MKWTLFDYGVGNIHSIQKALESTGRAVHVTTDAAQLAGAQAIVLPGVGAFEAVMAALEPARSALIAHHQAGKPLFGICIGMQVLYDGSDEAPGVAGLGIVTGQVQRLNHPKVPHMGWARVEGKLPFAGLPETMYFVHSYAAPAAQSAAQCSHGQPFAAAVVAGKTVGVQFHPEKSSTAGRTMLANALEYLE